MFHLKYDITGLFCLNIAELPQKSELFSKSTGNYFDNYILLFSSFVRYKYYILELFNKTNILEASKLVYCEYKLH